METSGARARMNPLKSARTIRKRGEGNIVVGLLFTAPAILGFLLFTLFPVVASLTLSFTDYGAFNAPKFIGLHNYQAIFSGKDVFFYKSLQVTLYYALLNIPASIIFALFLALLLNHEMKFKSLFRTVFFLPYSVPAVAASIIWLWMLNPELGFVNWFLTSLGLPKTSSLFAESTVIPTIVFIGLWGIGRMMIIFLAGLQDIPRQYYEAVAVDGGNSFHKMINVTLPLITPALFFNLIMSVIDSLQLFTQAYVLTDGGPNNASFFYVFYIYREAFKRANMGYASALAWILFVLILGLTILILKTQKKWVYYEGGEN